VNGPYCRSKQGRYIILTQELLIAVPTVVLIIVAIMVITWLAPEDGGIGGRSFSGHQSDLIVLGSSMDPDDKGNSDYWLTGVVSNQGVHPWRIDELEVRFVDNHGNLLDVYHPGIKHPFVVQSHRGHGFKVELGHLAFTNPNITRQVRVQTATDGDRPAKPD
jgi:hypothetical protein